MEPSKPPRVFISYSWESEDHKRWVRYLGERLCHAGIEARLDQWFVQPGDSFTAFMEQEVEAADFILVVCTPSYAHKSNKRQGGVGYEQQIVSGRLMSGTARSKFVPILRNGEYEPGPDCAIPTHFIGIAWIEFRDDVAFEDSLEDLIRVIFSKPRFAPPPLGARPSLETITDTKLNRIRKGLYLTGAKRVFISYSHEDRLVADKLKSALEGRGYIVRIDNAAMWAGANIQEFIESSIRDTDVTLSIISNRSLLFALESVTAFYSEKIRGDMGFIVCYLDDEFFETDFRLKATKQIDARIEEIDTQIPEYVALKIDTIDLNSEKSRLFKLRNNLGDILQKLIDSLTLDIRESEFDRSLARIIKSIEEIPSRP